MLPPLVTRLAPPGVIDRGGGGGYYSRNMPTARPRYSLLRACYRLYVYAVAIPVHLGSVKGMYWCDLNLALAPFTTRRVLVADDGMERNGIGWEPNYWFINVMAVVAAAPSLTTCNRSGVG